jgi:hypothetical protein
VSHPRTKICSHCHKPFHRPASGMRDLDWERKRYCDPDCKCAANGDGGVKYGAKKTVCGAEHLHDSGIEARRCDELRAKEIAGSISHLTMQPEFQIIVNDRKVCRYIADFQYRMTDSGLAIVEDVKGMTTPVFNLKRKLVEASYPGTVISIWPPRVRKKRKPATRKAA